MRRLLTQAIIVGVLCGGVWLGPASGSAGAAEGGQAAIKADHALTTALRRADGKAVGALLDAQFIWIDAEGKTHTKTQALQALRALAADGQGETGLQRHDYGRVATILGIHHNAHFARVWVRRQAGWRAFVFIDTPIPAHPPAMASVQRTAGPGDCENPCRTVPYKPTTVAAREILATWQKTKMDEWHPNADDWAKHIADEFLIINNSTYRNKPERVAIAKKQQEEGIGAPGDPIVSMRIFDFGNAGVMLSHHVRYRGGKPYNNVRVWVYRDGRWQLALSQQTANQAAAATPPVSAAK